MRGAARLQVVPSRSDIAGLVAGIHFGTIKIRSSIMRYSISVISAAAVAASLALAACDVKKTQEGNVTVPKYEVSKTQEGNVTLPKYDVTTPDVNVTKKEVDVTVPKVTTEKKEVTVPSIDVKTGQEKAAEKGK
jgi:hypothetical protein